MGEMCYWQTSYPHIRNTNRYVRFDVGILVSFYVRFLFYTLKNVNFQRSLEMSKSGSHSCSQVFVLLAPFRINLLTVCFSPQNQVKNWLSRICERIKTIAARYLDLHTTYSYIYKNKLCDIKFLSLSRRNHVKAT